MHGNYWMSILALYRIPQDRRKPHIVNIETGRGTSQLDEGFWMDDGTRRMRRLGFASSVYPAGSIAHNPSSN